MRMLKKTSHISLLVLVTMLAFFVTACISDSKDSLEEPLEEIIAGPADYSQFAGLDQLFGQLLDRRDLAELSVAETFTLISDFAAREAIEFDLNQAIQAYESYTGEYQPEFDRIERLVVGPVFQLVEEHGVGRELQLEMQGYRRDLAGRQSEMTREEYLLADYHAQFIEYLSVSETLQDYINAANDNALADYDPGEKGLFDCFINTTLLGFYTAQCACGKLYACALVPYYVYKVADSCGGSGPVDPCLNSPNPCCGSPQCASGYVQDVNCNCVVDPNDPGCINNPCPPGYSCAGNECIPW